MVTTIWASQLVDADRATRSSGWAEILFRTRFTIRGYVKGLSPWLAKLPGGWCIPIRRLPVFAPYRGLCGDGVVRPTVGKMSIPELRARQLS